MKTVRCFKCKSVMVIESELTQAKKEAYETIEKFIEKLQLGVNFSVKYGLIVDKINQLKKDLG